MISASGTMRRINRPQTMTEPQVFSHPSERAARGAIRLLLLLPFIGVLWIPSFSHSEPVLGGLPFSDWYLLVWIVLSAALVYAVYHAEN
jgi:hypothetical protein